MADCWRERDEATLSEVAVCATPLVIILTCSLPICNSGALFNL